MSLVVMGDVAAAAAHQPAQHQPAVHLRGGMPDDLLEQVLCFLPPTQALRCSRTSRAFLRAALASLERAAWPADPGTTSCHSNCCRAGNGSSGQDGLVGTPCLDLRDAGDTVDSRALLAVLGRIFVKPGGSSNGEGEGESRSSAVRKPAVLRGVAVRSAVIQDEAIELMLKLHGEGLEVLDLAGCGSLDASLTTITIRQHCKRLVALDLSGPFGENWGGAGAPPAAGAFAGRRGPGYGLFQNHTRKVPLVCHLMPLMSTVGGGLLVLSLRDRPDISDEEVRVVAEGCSKLREFDVGTGRRTGRFANITGQGLGYLYRARCARSLVYLGLRNQHAIGHLDLRALGSQLPSLRRLDLAGVAKVDDEVLKALASTLSLSHVDLSRSHHVSAAGVSALALASPELECVSLHGIVGLVDEAIRALCDACPKLRHINVSMTRVTERGLRLLAVKDSLRWVNICCCPWLFDDAPTRKVLAAFRSRLSMPKHPRDRGTVLGMERPQTQLRVRPPDRPPRGPHGGGASGHRGRADGRAQTSDAGVGGGETCRRASSGSGGGNAYRGDVVPSGAGGSGGDGDGNGSAAAAKAASVEGCAGGLVERKVSSSVSPTQETASPAAVDKGPRGGEAPRREQRKNHAHAQQSQQSHAAPPAEAPASTTSAGKEPPGTASAPAASTATAAVSSAAADASAAPRRADALPLLPAGVGNLSLGQHHRHVGAQRRKAVGTTPRDSGDPTQGQGRLRSRDDRRFGDGENDRGRGGGEEAIENETGVVVPFDWDTIPRGSVGGLGSWRGFRGMSGDLVRKVIQELHPYAQVEFRAESDSLLGPPTRKNNHGYLVHTSRWGQAWVEFEVDDQGCVV